VKKIFRRQRGILGHVPPSESKGCRARSLNGGRRLALSRARVPVCCICIFTDQTRRREGEGEHPSRCTSDIFIYIARAHRAPSRASRCRRPCERGYYVRDAATIAPEIERAWEGREGWEEEEERDIKWPGTKSAVKMPVEAERGGALRARKGT